MVSFSMVSFCSWNNRSICTTPPICNGWSLRKIPPNWTIASAASTILRLVELFYLDQIYRVQFFSIYLNILSQAKTTYPYRAPEANTVVDTWFCSNKRNTTTLSTRTSDICSYYFFSDSFMCKVTHRPRPFWLEHFRTK